MNHKILTVQETLACYQEWNTSERAERLRNAGQKSVEQKCREYLDLMAFGMAIKPEPSVHEYRQKIDMLNRYYEHIALFEKRRTQFSE